ncbi:hypothetical protein YUYDRAFT_02125 [Streptomyces sp. ScaeMP-e48]|uniref:hypothetical protein n=1 Tax=Streptomyces sp. ScaeMP-e48 TaxID=1100823 RepID=UPI000823A795|nr:hypothetical protein [Streptomyces sp. ScaeMP-e48]SCK20373.1 hypothetical protein YUYDRAFT_02125 [Streptomyces sp. ScaeMP-e48]
MFGRRNRQQLADLRARVESLVEQRDAACKDAAAFLSAAKRTAARNVHLSDQLEAVKTPGLLRDAITYTGRIARLAHAVARLRQALAAETRRADRLQARLDDTWGISSPAVDAGARWQQTRTDKNRGVKP